MKNNLIYRNSVSTVLWYFFQMSQVPMHIFFFFFFRKIQSLSVLLVFQIISMEPKPRYGTILYCTVLYCTVLYLKFRIIRMWTYGKVKKELSKMPMIFLLWNVLYLYDYSYVCTLIFNKNEFANWNSSNQYKCCTLVV